MNEPSGYIVKFRRGPGSIPLSASAKKALKMALRTYNLICEDIEDIDEPRRIKPTTYVVDNSARPKEHENRGE